MQEDCHMVRGRQHKSYWPTSEDGNLSQSLLQRKLKLQQNPTLLHQGLYKVSGITGSRLAEVLDFRGNYGVDISLLQLWGPIAPVKLANQWLPELTGSQADTSILDSLFGTGEACKDLDWDVLELLLVWVDKENSMEFSFDYGTLLIHLLCLLLFINSCASLLVVSSHTSTNFLIKRKEKKMKMNNNLAIFGCVMTRLLKEWQLKKHE